jgi:hypothetical protein
MVFRGRPDSAKLRELGDQAMKVLEDETANASSGAQ